MHQDLMLAAPPSFGPNVRHSVTECNSDHLVVGNGLALASKRSRVASFLHKRSSATPETQRGL